MTKTKKIIIAIAVVLSIVVLINVAANYFVNKQLPLIIADKNKTNYSITYQTLTIDMIDKNISAQGIAITPKSKAKVGVDKLGIYSKINSVEIRDFKIWDILFNDKIKANSITINSPEVILYKEDKTAVNDSKNISSEVVAPFQQIIAVSKITMNKGTVKIIHTKTKKPILNVSNMHLEVNGIVIDEETLNQTIPFQFETYSFSGDSVYYRANDFYHISLANIKTTEKDLKISKFKLIPEYTRHEFISKLEKEKDLFTLQADAISITNLNWGFKDSIPYFEANKIALNKLAANIYRNKLPTDDLSKKPLYNKLLRDLKFPLKVDTLAITNSQLVYEEEINFAKGPGMLTFDKFNLTATHLQSGYKQTKLDDVIIDINCNFMNNSPFKVNWTFNIMDKTDGFKFHGKITNLNTADLSRFTKPYINATTTGTFDYLDFTINGNDYNSEENAALKYHNLKVKLFRKNDRAKESKIKSVIANLVVKNDTDGEIKNTTVKTERVPEKSFFNFLWLNVAGILKQIVI
ncbi:hypothetical protein [Flavobacterium frigidarium]|uniref:hypothetical protein n=1 Tax=Flavobacterium frigidarium TaxID=99286 RepID=UPI00040E9928|nr:hypothetical protein [Flavobacterium frigidarium]